MPAAERVRCSTADAFVRSGKVRDLYELPDDRLLLVASDRISAFDVVLPTEIPDKGRVLTGLSRFWFAETAGDRPEPPPVGRSATAGDATAAELRGRSMICRRVEVDPVRGDRARLPRRAPAGRTTRRPAHVCGIRLPAGLRESDRLPEPIFTPATKAEQGHDENISFDAMAALVGRPLAERVRAAALALYGYATAIAARAGHPPRRHEVRVRCRPGRTASSILIDEALTPGLVAVLGRGDLRAGPTTGQLRQAVRARLAERQPWDKTAPGPALPAEVVEGTRDRYVEAYERITGASFDRYLAEDVIAR